MLLKKMRIDAAEAVKLLETAKHSQLPVGIDINSSYEATTWTAYSAHVGVSRHPRVHIA